jgi:hypothetical protein
MTEPLSRRGHPVGICGGPTAKQSIEICLEVRPLNPPPDYPGRRGRSRAWNGDGRPRLPLSTIGGKLNLRYYS